jgi:hypothetical protein
VSRSTVRQRALVALGELDLFRLRLVAEGVDLAHVAAAAPKVEHADRDHADHEQRDTDHEEPRVEEQDRDADHRGDGKQKPWCPHVG